MLRAGLRGKRLRLSDDDRRRLAVKAQALGREALTQIASVATRATLLRWYRHLIAAKYDGSKNRSPGRPPTAKDIRELIVRVARENPTWGYTRLRGALKNLLYQAVIFDGSVPSGLFSRAMKYLGFAAALILLLVHIWFWDASPPTINWSGPEFFGEGSELELTVHDEGRGLRSISVEVRQHGNLETVFSRAYPTELASLAETSGTGGDCHRCQ